MAEANARPTTLVSHDEEQSQGLEIATFAAGCFWVAEDTFARFGTTIVGYSGGVEKQPSHSQVSRGHTGHAEAVRLAFDPVQTPYTELLAVFFSAHDATRRKAKSQYRSAIFFHTVAQEEAARTAIAAHSKSLLTELLPAGPFWRAAEVHQHYNAKAHINDAGRHVHMCGVRSVAKPCCLGFAVDASRVGSNVRVEQWRRRAGLQRIKNKPLQDDGDTTRV